MAAGARQRPERRRMLYGGLLIALLIGSAMLTFFLRDLLNLFERTYTVVALVPDAPDLARGSPVWVGGRRVGEVSLIALLPPGRDSLERVAVTLELPERVQDQVRTDSRVRVTTAGMMGERVVDVLPGSPQAAPLRPGDTLRLASRPTAAQVTAQAAQVRAELDTVMADLRALAPVARARLDDTQRAVRSLDAAATEARRLRADVAANPGLALVSDPAFGASLHRAREHAAALPAAIETLRGRATEGGDVAVALGRLRARADTLAAHLDAAAALLDEAQGSLGRLQLDPALPNAVTAARAALDSLLAEVRRNPLRFVF
jgi:phospholipid/cholesterol/gamma-HCH transport system substrate-binding protein